MRGLGECVIFVCVWGKLEKSSYDCSSRSWLLARLSSFPRHFSFMFSVQSTCTNRPWDLKLASAGIASSLLSSLLTRGDCESYRDVSHYISVSLLRGWRAWHRRFGEIGLGHRGKEMSDEEFDDLEADQLLGVSRAHLV